MLRYLSLFYLSPSWNKSGFARWKYIGLEAGSAHINTRGDIEMYGVLEFQIKGET